MQRDQLSKFFPFFLFSFSLFFLNLSVNAADQTVTGTIVSATNEAGIEFVNIVAETGAGTYTDEAGKFSLPEVQLPTKLTISHIAFRDTVLTVTEYHLGIIRLVPEVIPGEGVFVTATRAIEGITPVAFSNLSTEEIKNRYNVEDVPMVLAMEPGVYSYSESGNGTGYSYVQIRGFDQSRIAVMLDNVPLNDNESYQVYWVDHADILGDAEVVQVQRGVGNSLYGSSAFGGSINVQTGIASDSPNMSLAIGGGSYNTSKIGMRFTSGKLWSDRINLSARLSQIQSDGYRENHASYQRAASFAVDYYGNKITHEFRSLIGYENTQLDWWGVPPEDLNNRKKRRAGYKTYIDDFFQQIYSLNSSWNINDNWHFSNVAYLVKGSGYYETGKSASYDLAQDDSSAMIDFHDFLLSYDLDQFYPVYPWANMPAAALEFSRRKWIVNHYYGIIPTLTYMQKNYRLDIGGELRIYSGDHFGEIADLSDESIQSQIGRKWHRYYRYIGDKTIGTAFVHGTIDPVENLKLIADLQLQHINWTLDQSTIGHAAGYQLNADWNFVNPRLGAIYSIGRNHSVFVNYGKAQREPADNQIIEADDIWGEPQIAAAELVDDYELGTTASGNSWKMTANLYRINYSNEQLKNIDIEQEGEYDYYQAGSTLHQGLEIEFAWQPSAVWSLNLNGSISQHVFNSGVLEDNRIPNVPGTLFNASISVNPLKVLSFYLNSRYVGEMAIDDQNIGINSEYWLVDAGIRYTFRNIEISAKLNNIFDTLYSTSGYGYEWDGYWASYWPGATRNGFISVTYSL